MPIYVLDDLVPHIHPDAYVHPDAVIIGDVRIGAESSIWPGAVLRGDHGSITIGDRTSIQDGTVVHTTKEWPTVVGNDCVVGHVVHIEGCTIEDRCLIGSGSVVLNRVTVGSGSVVGAQALVPEDLQIPPKSMAVGVPARSRPMTNDEATTWIDYAVDHYRHSAARYRIGLRLFDPDVDAVG